MQINPQTPINLTLNVESTNVILGALSAHYDKVAGLIAAIQQQAGPQIQPPEAPPAPESQEPNPAAK